MCGGATTHHGTLETAPLAVTSRSSRPSNSGGTSIVELRRERPGTTGGTTTVALPFGLPLVASTAPATTLPRRGWTAALAGVASVLVVDGSGGGGATGAAEDRGVSSPASASSTGDCCCASGDFNPRPRDTSERRAGLSVDAAGAVAIVDVATPPADAPTAVVPTAGRGSGSASAAGFIPTLSTPVDAAGMPTADPPLV